MGTTLTFRCPKTGNDIDTGISADAETLERLNILFVRIPCPYCRHDHFPQIKRGAFVPPPWSCEEMPPEMVEALGWVGGTNLHQRW